MRTNLTPKALLSALVFALASPALAHEGHDHGPPAVELPTSNQPRAIAASEDYEIVAVLKGEELFIYVDRFADNSPVTEARLTVTFGTTDIQTKLMPDGVFKLESRELRRPGKHELIFAVEEGSKSDLLITSLEVPELALELAPQSNSDRFLTSHLETAISTVKSWVTPRQIGVTGGILGVLLLALLILRRRKARALKAVVTEVDQANADAAKTGVSKLRPRSAGPAAAAAILLLLVSPATRAVAHGDEDHGDAKQSIAFAGDAPRRLPDASVYLPKPSQRLLEVRTIQARETTTQPSVSFVGRIIANPDRFAVVQSTLGGRFTAPASGLPKLGQAVRAGEVLGYVAPYIATIDRSDAAQTAGNLEQEIALAENRLARAKRLLAVNAGTRVQVEEIEIQLKGLEKRRADLRANQTTPEPLVAPIEGVIAATKVVAGQVIEAKDVLYEIIDPSSLWVEAFAFDQSAPQAFSEASATAHNSASFKLRFIGRSRALRQQSTVLHFAIENPATSLNVGMPVTVLVREGAAIKGIVLPKAAVVRAGNGENVVWQHREPERFIAAPVKVSSFDGERVLVKGGLKAGERIVVEGAELINQVR
ncbi:MAG: efflux RND transporter periplasmic adaptor subunit [Hyphomicrobium sp.]|uniref:efflux RND transporter periplasmic adaptor subunit n=1 Tax=Hyphomicrobium sp. TaxID=82 RepID=UPI0025B93206|nr:efflux RND transporter periplasmic adaptor subunit [Hyphomicrobium sp.]MBZ0209675.1 efflux RND transporter periplasmic adaptor subunit [Hyphomicrobium sp.]